MFPVMLCICQTVLLMILLPTIPLCWSCFMLHVSIFCSFVCCCILCVTKVYQPSLTEYKGKEKPSSHHNQGCGIKNKRNFFSSPWLDVSWRGVVCMSHLSLYKIMVMHALWSMVVKKRFKYLCMFYVCCKFLVIIILSMHACSTKIYIIDNINTKTLSYYVWVKRSVWLSWNASNDSDCSSQSCKLPLLYNSRFTFIGFWFQCLIIVALEILWWSFTDDLVILFFTFRVWPL